MNDGLPYTEMVSFSLSKIASLAVTNIYSELISTLFLNNIEFDDFLYSTKSELMFISFST